MSFAPRRPKAARKIIATAHSSDDDAASAPKIVRKKAAPASRSASPAPSTPSTPSERPKIKKKASSRLSFGGPLDDDDGDAAEVFVPKKSALSRKAMQRNAARKAAVGMEQLSLTPGQERVSYSKEYLDELKAGQLAAAAAAAELEGATLVAEEDAMVVEKEEEDSETEAEKLRGAVVVRSDELPGGAIMDEGLVRVMKERRKERAAAGKLGATDFISLNDAASDEESGELMLRPKKKKESRLQLNDDGGDDEIGNYADATGLISDKAAARRRKLEIRDAIADAEGGDSDGSRDSLVSDFEADQIRAGAFATAHASQGIEAELEAIARNPPAVQKLPEIGEVVARLQAGVAELRVRMEQTERVRRGVQEERRGIGESEGRVQRSIGEVGAKYEELKKETGLAGGGEEGVVSRGLESFGGTPVKGG
ncbi:nineteen complex-related protein 2-domain-containing protein [Geopyxis carbonaria]|nr:nineteen complex-related protein 2-domain-containing protein [Geopyxis carbonaria]